MEIPAARIYGVMARDAPVCVLFRRGPSKLVQVIKWNTEDDTFEEGQWLKGRIFSRRADLRPDGKYMAYFAADHRAKRYHGLGGSTWTAISKPPYLTALAIWVKNDTWSGGGIFTSNRNFVLSDYAPHDGKRIVNGCPFKIEKSRKWPGEDWAIERVIREKVGWRVIDEMVATHTAPTFWRMAKSLFRTLKGDKAAHLPDPMDEVGFVTHEPRVLQKNTGSSSLKLMQWLTGYRKTERYEFRRGKQEIVLSDATWAELDHRGRFIFSRAGKIFVCDLAQKPQPKELADFNDNVFTPVPPPEWATRW